MTGREFLFQDCDGELTDENLSAEGNAFATYYEPDTYLHDYDEILGADLSTMYHVEDDWAAFDELVTRLDQRHVEWKVRAAT